MNLAEISFKGHFAACISEYIAYAKPKRLLETGLYHGMGSTRVIATAIRNNGLTWANFYSIECNNDNINIAKENLRHGDLLPYVVIVSGLSIPEELLPTLEETEKRLKVARGRQVVIDHLQDPEKASTHYQNETLKFDRDDRIGDVLHIIGGKLDFVLLDSAGHIGTIEFQYLIGNMKSPCAIALDDTNHFKHFETVDIIKNDSRFTILDKHSEKNGSMLVNYIPK